MMGVKTIWELCLFESRTLWPTLEIANGDIYFFDRKRLELKNIAIGQKLKPSRLKTLKLKNYQKTLKSDDVSTFTQRHFQVKMNKKKLFEYKYTKNKSLENKKIGTQCVHGRTCNVWGRRSFLVILHPFISNMRRRYINIKSATKINLLRQCGFEERVNKVYFRFDTLEFLDYLNKKRFDEHLLCFEYFQLINLYFGEGCMKALGNEQFLNTCVSLTTFLHELYMYQHNILNKSNKRHQLIRWLGIVLDLPEDVWSHWGINSALIPVSLQQHSCMKLYIYEQSNVNKANKSHQLIRWFRIFLDLLQDVWKYWATNSFLTPLFVQEYNIMKINVYQYNNQGSYPFSETNFQNFSRTFQGHRLIFQGL